MGLTPYDRYPDGDPDDLGPEPPEDWARLDSEDEQERREEAENGPWNAGLPPEYWMAQ